MALSSALICQYPKQYDGKQRKLLHSDSAQILTAPIISLINYFTLTEDGAVPNVKGHPGKFLVRILSILITRAFQKKAVSPPNGSKWDDFMNENTLEPNRTGSPCQFTRKQDEQEGDKLLFSLCEMLNIKLCHGSLESPKNPNEVVGQGGIKSQRGLTSHGLESLHKEIRENELALLFNNGNIDVVHKHNGCLFVLETGKQPTSMWRMLAVKESDLVLFDSTFLPLEMKDQPNGQQPSVVLFMQQWREEKERASLECYAKLQEFETAKEEIAKIKKAAKKKKPGNKNTNLGDVQDPGSTSDDKEPIAAEGTKVPPAGHVQDSGSTSDGKESIAAEGTKVPPAGHIGDLDEYKSVKEKFKEFLLTYVDPADDSPKVRPFYVRMVEGWVGLESQFRPYSAIIYFPHVEAFSRELAFAILNDRTRLHDVLAEVFLDFRADLNCGKKKHLKGKVKVRFLGMPPAGSMCSFEEFIKSTNARLVEPHILYDGQVLNLITYIGRRAGKGYVDYFLENHRNGKGWNGKFSKPDLVMRNGRFEILQPATEDVTMDIILADFVRLTELLFEFYQLDCVDEAPAYLHAFQSDILQMGKYKIKTPEYRLFQRYLSNHLAFKAPSARAGLFIDMWSVIQSLRERDPATRKRGPFLRLKTDYKHKFPDKFVAGWFFQDVYNHDNPMHTRYADLSQLQLLELIRHLEMHLHDHTRDNKQQLLQDIMLVDLMIEKTFKSDVSVLVYQMMVELNDAPFSNSWRHFEMFECGDELQYTVSESGNGSKVKSEGSLPSGVGSGSNTEESAPVSAAPAVLSGAGSGSNTEESAPPVSAVSSVLSGTGSTEPEDVRGRCKGKDLAGA